MAGACADAKAALAQTPNDKTAFGISQLACRDIQVPKAEAPKPESEKSPPPPPTDAQSSGKDILHAVVPTIGMRAPSNKTGPNNGPETPNDKLRRLGALKADGNYVEVVVQADEVLKVLPDNEAALEAKALAQNRTKDYTGALQTADRAIKVSTGNAAAYANKAYALGALGNRKGMIESLKKAAELDSRYEAALQKALDADTAGLFDMPGEVTESKLQGTKAKEGAGLNPEMLKWIVIAAVVIPLTGLVFFFVLRNTVLKTPPPKPATPWPGGESERLQGKYELGPQIGAGGMGMVFEGRDISLNRKVAIKKMLPQLSAQPKLRERFIGEARAVAALHHPNVVDIHAIVEEGRELYLIFEFVKGRTLSDLVAERVTLAFADSVAIVRDIARALDFAHGQGIIHRDLKPSNVMVGETGRVVVMDFGLARTVQDLMTQAALTNTIAGTPAYMAPEQENGVVCKQSDVYALAVCLYEMLCGKRPFDGAPGAMMVSKLGMMFQPVTRVVAGLPGGLDAFFVRALAADPAKRYATPKEFVAALDAITPVPASR